MPYTVVFAPEADAQLEEIYLYIAAQATPATAERLTVRRTGRHVCPADDGRSNGRRHRQALAIQARPGIGSAQALRPVIGTPGSLPGYFGADRACRLG